MSKTIAGIVLVLGLLVCFAGSLLGSMAANAKSTPDTDWLYELGQYGGGALGFFGIVLFFVGAWQFARR